MKPSFALSLSHEGIRLLHRGRGGWVSVGEVALDDPDFSDRLAWLRKTAAALAQGAVTTKLVIPNSEILYDRIELKIGSAEKREAQLRGALEGRTPYPVSQLAYDYVLEGNVAQVAVVATETLAEAEAFATEHRFNPVCFVAVPPGKDPNDTFNGEPMFGTTKAAKALLDPNDPVEREFAAVKVVGSAQLPDAGLDAPIVDVDDDGVPQDAVDATAASPADTAPDTPAPKAEAVEQEVAETSPVVAPAEDIDLDPAAVAANLVIEGMSPKAEPEAPEPEKTPQEPAETADETASEAGSEPTAPEADAEPKPDPAPSFFASRRSRTPPPAVAADSADEDAADAPPVIPPSSLKGRRSRLGFGGLISKPAEADATDAPEVDVPAPEAKPRLEPSFGSRRKAPKTPEDEAIPPVAPEAPLSTKPPAPGEPSPAALARLAAIVPQRSDRPEKSTAIADGPDTALLGVSPLQSGNPAPLIKKPIPIGFILSGVLLAILLLGALALMIFIEPAEQASFTPEEARAALELAQELEDLRATPEPRLDLPETTEQASLAPQIVPDQRELDEAELADAEPNSPEALAEPELPGIDADFDTPPATPRVTLVEAEARYAETGIWTRSPDALPQPVFSGLEDLYLANLDPEVLASDAIALPGYVQGRDLRLVTPSAPVGPGVEFALDENGLVTPTAEGTLTPDGTLVFLPAEDTLRPIARPTGDGAAVQDGAADTQLAAVRPRARPENASELLERTILGGFTRAELAALRPRARPESEQAIASAAAVAAGASTAGVLDGTEPDAEISGSELAVASSRTPNLRPSNIQQIVATARATPQPTRVAAIRTPAASPQIPTRASVARQATIENGISLRRVNLIGVYGSSSNRRALVRLPNGRFVKVEVGDRVDGGRVAAIGQNSLQYVKSGRNQTLTLPTEG